MKYFIVGVLLIGLSGCAGTGSIKTDGVTWGSNCEHQILKQDGTTVCVSEESMIAFYKTQTVIANKKARLEAITAAGDNTGQLVLLAFESQKSDGIEIEKSMSTFQKVLLTSREIRSWVIPFYGGSGESSGSPMGATIVKGDKNTIHFGNTETAVGKDQVISDTETSYETTNTQIKSPNGYTGEPYVINTELEKVQ